jgi:hypothetical protein
VTSSAQAAVEKLGETPSLSDDARVTLAQAPIIYPLAPLC